MRIAVLVLAFAIVIPSRSAAQDVVPAVGFKTPPEAFPGKGRDLSQKSPSERNIYVGAFRAMEWLHKANKADGRFVYGFLPALRAPMEGDSYLDQVGACYALGRASKYFGDDRSAAVAKQALLTLLLETAVDPQNPQVRRTAASDDVLHRVASSGMLLTAIHAQPNPASDLLQSADQIAAHLERQLAPDGSFRWGTDDPSLAKNLDRQFSGIALLGIVRSHAQRPASWKLEALKKGRATYFAMWKKDPDLAMIPTHSAAYAEAFALTKDRAYADAVFEMNDWMLSLQYRDLDPRRRHWAGGFQTWRDGKAISAAPDIASAACAESLVEACRTARLAGDAQRLQRYREALESALAFLGTLQYGDSAVQHYAEWFRPAILGGFHASNQDGNLRLDYAWHALSAQAGYLTHVSQ